MVRSAAKNHAHVAIVTDPADYDELLVSSMRMTARRHTNSASGWRPRPIRSPRLMILMISQWFAFADQGQRWPETWVFANRMKMPLRYGENPHQLAALYEPIGPHSPGIAQAKQVQGKELSYNNLNDANAALDLVAEFRDGPSHDRDRQARQPVRRRERGTLAGRLERCACVRQRLGVRRDRRDEPRRSMQRLRKRSPKSSPKSWSRPTPTRTPRRSSRKKKFACY